MEPAKAITTHTEISRPPISDLAIITQINLGTNADFTQPLIRCGTCGCPVQYDVVILDIKRRVPIKCPCQQQKAAKEAAAENEYNLRRKLDKFRAYSLMDDRFAESTFENWVIRDDNRELLNLGKQYCQNWETMLANNRGLLMHGVPGNGKTFFTFAIANELYRQGIAVMAISVSRILDIIRDSYDSFGDQGASIMHTISEASLLILDDLGVEYKTQWAYEKLYTIIDIRYRAKKPTIITTNLEIDKSKNIDELRDSLAIIDARTRQYDTSHRIYNRIVQMCAFFSIKGESWRTQKGEENKKALLKELGRRQA